MIIHHIQFIKLLLKKLLHDSVSIIKHQQLYDGNQFILQFYAFNEIIPDYRIDAHQLHILLRIYPFFIIIVVIIIL